MHTARQNKSVSLNVNQQASASIKPHRKQHYLSGRLTRHISISLFCVHMAEKKVKKTKAPSDYLSDSESSEDEVNPYLRTSQEERV